MRCPLSLVALPLALAVGCGPAAAPPPDEDGGDAGPVCADPEDCDLDGVARDADCDDADADVAPGLAEVVGNGIDDDCDPSTPDAERVELAPTAGRIFVEIPADLDGAGSDRVGAISLTGSVGTIEVDGESLAAFVDERVPWPTTGYVMQQILAVGEDRIVTIWVYCEDETLSYLYLGDVAPQPLDAEPATGSCAEWSEPAWVDLSLPAVSLSIPPLVTGFTVDGPAITVRDGDVGAVQTDVRGLTLLPYRVVDCSTECGGAGWFELHSLLWSSTEQVASFAILYLHLDETLGAGRDVSLVTSRPLPAIGAGFPDGATFAATFTTP